mmetsp:Transcript_14042/g.34631  ORF Transcript_14042/g.34631 Transcript_14042/m.34631 type:complete len:260 (+) Transcript_14042:58-837(+)
MQTIICMPARVSTLTRSRPGRVPPMAPPSMSPARRRVLVRYTEKETTLNQEERLLVMLQNDLHEFCEEAEGIDIDDARQCHIVESWYENKLLNLKDDPESAEQLQALRNMVRQLASAGDMNLTIKSLLSLKNAEARHAAAAAAGAEDTPCLAEATAYEMSEERQRQMVAAFHKEDSNGDGKLTRIEFERAMHSLGNDLTEVEMEMVGCALELAAQVELDDFLAAVEEVEAARRMAACAGSPLLGSGSDASFLLAVKHHH